MKLDTTKHRFCCLGVKTNAADAFDELTDEQQEALEFGDLADDLVHMDCEYIPGEDENAQAFFATLNDDMSWDFHQIAQMIEILASSGNATKAAVDWVSNMDAAERSQPADQPPH